MAVESEMNALQINPGKILIDDTFVRDTSRAVSTYWFPNRAQTLEAAYKKKWFATDDTVTIVDEEIRTRFADIIHALELAVDGDDIDRTRVLGAHARWLQAPATTAALVVLLDQFSRHVYRNRDDRDAKVKVNDTVATIIAEDLLDNKREWLVELTVPEQVFVLMPFRHTQKSCPRLLRCLDTIDARVAMESENKALLERFRKTTLRCYQDLQGKQHKAGDNILEREEFTPTEGVMTAMASHTLYKTIEAFMRDRMSEFGNSIAVSLSGGVDSMVLAYILKHQGYDVVTLHIDYKNRPESTEEADFVDDWSLRHGMKFERCTVDQIRRGVTPREQYEIESRRIRYGFYKEAGAKHGFPAVLLGHHHGDVQENIITNLMRGANLLSVNGMSDEGVVEGVRIWRPMLSHVKDDVLTFAHAYGIPYFLDSTPTWSTRGKLRNQLVPLLEDMFGIGLLRNLSVIGENSEQLSEMVDKSLFKPFWDATKSSDVGCYVDCEPFISQPIFFWKQVIRETCHGLGASMMKDRSVRLLLARIKRERSTKDGWLCLKKENATFMHGNTFGMFTTEFMPRSDTIVPGTPIVVSSSGASFDIGNWHIDLEVVSNVSVDGNQCPLEGPAITVWNVLENDISYHIPYKDGTNSYVIDPEIRFPPTQNLDTAVRDALPLVVPSALSFAHLPKEDRPPRKANRWDRAMMELPTCVKVTLKFRRTKLYVVSNDDDDAS
jgi:tRNA(Ile)-lysidine synthetase-like protein|tara:strand:- start:15705 stop:17867 length:2163 start_codon:yes stop_codon:yes gene_type:complete